jgi:hypothetical protein
MSNILPKKPERIAQQDTTMFHFDSGEGANILSHYIPSLPFYQNFQQPNIQAFSMVQTEAQYRFIYEAIAKYTKKHFPNELRKPKRPMNGHEVREEKFLDADDDY